MRVLKLEMQKVPVTAHIVQSVEEAEKAIPLITEARYTLDLETTYKEGFDKDPMAGLDPHRSRIRLLTLYANKQAFVFDLAKIGSIPDILKDKLKTLKLVAHNAIFDLSHLRPQGIKLLDCDCTLLMANLVHHATVGGPLKSGLDALLLKEFNIALDKTHQTSDWSRSVLSDAQLLYAIKDVFYTGALYTKYAPKIQSLGLTKVYLLNKQAQHVVVDMQLTGIKMDREKHLELIQKWESVQEKASEKIRETLGDININSGKQLSEWIETNADEATKKRWPKTETGNYKTDYDTLQDFKHLPFVEPLAEYKEFSKLTSTYGRPLLSRTNPVTGRVHGGYTLCRTETGRLSGRDPNLQNCPRDGNFRSLFIAGKENVMLCADYNQIELRVLAEISRDPAMMQAYKDGIDLHRLTGSKITGKPVSELTKDERQTSKSVNFGLIFGMGASKLSLYAKLNYGVHIPQEMSEEYVRTFHELYAGYAIWKKKTTALAQESLLSTTALGKNRALHPDKYYSVSLNHPVQGSAAEVMLFAMCFIHKEIDDNKIPARIVNVVHDEVLIECRKSCKEEVKELIKRNMEKAFHRVFPTATLRGLVAVGEGPNWEDAK